MACFAATRCGMPPRTDADGIADLTYIDNRRLKANADAAVLAIEFSVVEAGEHHVIHCDATGYCRNERTNQEPCD